MNRGYSLDRGKGQRKRQPTRHRCPNCAKRGLGPFNVEETRGRAVITRTCRYCMHLQFKTYIADRAFVVTDVFPKGATPGCPKKTPENRPCSYHAGHSGACCP